MKSIIPLVLVSSTRLLFAGTSNLTVNNLDFTYSRTGFPIPLSGSATHYYSNYHYTYPLPFDTVPNLEIVTSGKAIASYFGKFSLSKGSIKWLS